MSHKSSASYLYLGAAAVVVILLIVVATRDAGPSKYDSFAQCLTENGVKMWGTWWCPHCANQKALFEGAFDHIEYIECSTPGSRAMTQVCRDAGIQGYPTWEFADGSRLSGERTLEELGEKAACELPAP
ncbi:hypothetical protein FJZ23_02740 [Candidatus Parcubacteria bacterium]|nr:hypothetical protein [Candidatus Parcubacteria bacterium]